MKESEIKIIGNEEDLKMIEKVEGEEGVENKEHLRRLIQMMDQVKDFPALDEYGSKLFAHPLVGTWELFRRITRMAISANFWIWSPERERASYPKEIVPTLEDFATIMLHEVTHGWYYFCKKDLRSDRDSTDEERICWEVSQLVCDMLGITYQKKLGDLAFQAYILSKDHKSEEFLKVFQQMPTHLKK